DRAQVTREPDEIHLDREQHQFDSHQQDDDGLPDEEDAGDADAEQHRAEHKEITQRDHGYTSRRVSNGMLTTRTRSAAFTATWSPMFWCFVPTRRRSVSAMAAMIATVRMTPAISNGSR